MRLKLRRDLMKSLKSTKFDPFRLKGPSDAKEEQVSGEKEAGYLILVLFFVTEEMRRTHKTNIKQVRSSDQRRSRKIAMCSNNHQRQKHRRRDIEICAARKTRQRRDKQRERHTRKPHSRSSVTEFQEALHHTSHPF